MRDTLTWLAGRLAASAELRALATVYDRQPPTTADAGGAS